MSGPFVVECEAGPLMTDLLHPPGHPIQPHRRDCGPRVGPAVAINRAEWVAAERVLQVGQEQLLVLLLVVQAEHDQRPENALQAAVGTVEQRAHPRVDRLAIPVDLGDRRASEQPAFAPRDPLADRVVVGIEQETIFRWGDPVAGRGRLDDERLEEPARVCQVPLGGAGVGHRLDDVVLDLQRRARATP